RDVLTSESRVAGLLQMLHTNKQYTILESLFFGELHATNAMWKAITRVYDPFATLDPTKQLDHVGLSPVGIGHLFREYFFELDTFLGSPVGHVWLSPGSTVELFEIHTRRVLEERAAEQSIESLKKSDKSLTQEDDLSTAVKEDNRSD